MSDQQISKRCGIIRIPPPVTKCCTTGVVTT